MQKSISLQARTSPPHLFFVFLILALSLFLYYQIRAVQIATSPLVEYLQEATGIEAPAAVFEEAIRVAAEKMSDELGIDLGNYDISLEQYKELAAAAAEKFGVCEQYRIYSVTGGNYNCFNCITKPRILLIAGQTYRYGQTCLGKRGRYAKGLPEPGLLYIDEFKGSIFEVLIMEHIKLKLFRFSKERQMIIKQNNLMDTELLLPPANKILR